jgi:hypothetical protein
MRHHFILTLQWTVPEGLATETQHGTVGVPPGMTRNDALKNLIEQMRRGRAGSPVVLFFSFAPDNLS